jgi:hypothetical protein
MGVKKKKEESTKLVSKIFIVGICLLFVGLMILSGMGTSWLTIFSSVKPGDTVVIDYTIFDAGGKPVVTTEKSTQIRSGGQWSFWSRQITLIANQTMEKPIYSIPVYPSNGGSVQQLGLFSTEYNAVSSGIIGMKVNEQKRIPISSETPMTYEWSAERLALNKINIITSVSGTTSLWAFLTILMLRPTHRKHVLKDGVSSKSPDGIMVDFSYPSIDVRVVSINNQ